MTKKEKREIITRSLLISYLISAASVFISVFTLAFLILIMKIANDEMLANNEFLLMLIALPAIVGIMVAIFIFLKDYREEKKYMQKIKRKEAYIKGCFYQGDIWVIPTKHKGYSKFFENLSASSEITYYASFTKEETIKIFITIDGDKTIEFEEIKKADFLDFYQIDKAKL